MSALTNLALVAAAVGGTYYVLEYRPRQERKRKAAAKKKVVLPPPPPEEPEEPEPQSQVLVLSSVAELGQHESELVGRPVFMFMPMALGSVYEEVAPIVDELSIQYPDVLFVEMRMGAIIEEMLADFGEVKKIKSNVASVGGGFFFTKEEFDIRCADLFEGPVGFNEQLEANDETMTSKAECVEVDTRNIQNVIQQLTNIAEHANDFVGLAAARVDTGGRLRWPIWGGVK